MGDVHSFDFEAGTGVGASTEDKTMLVLGQPIDESVKWIRLPPDLGGEIAEVLCITETTCACPRKHAVQMAVMKNPETLKGVSVGQIGVYECTLLNKFMWVRVPTED